MFSLDSGSNPQRLVASLSRMYTSIRRPMFGLPMLVFMAGILWAFHGATVDNSAIFELDGNALDETGIGAPTGADWSTLNPPNGAANGSVARAFITDPAGVSIFTQGGSKDHRDIPDWKFTSGSSPDKDEIVNAYAAAYNVGGDLVFYFGADRFSNDGDANLGFWFLQQNVGCTPDPTCGGTGSFTGAHTVNDVLVVSEFVGGGSTPVIKVFKWVGTGGTEHNGTTNLIFDSNTAKCAPGTGTNTVCGIVNAASTPAPWPYTPKPNAGPPGAFPTATYFEGGININAMLGPNLPCFSSFVAETRSSSSIQAILKDLVIGRFETCGITIAKACTACNITGGGTQFTYTYDGVVTNTGFGKLYNVIVVDDAGTPGVPADDITTNLGELLPGAINAKPFGGTFNSTQTPKINRASVSAAAFLNGPNTVVPNPNQPALANCPACNPNPLLLMTKSCDTKLVAQSNLVAVKVDFRGTITNNGNVALTNVVVKDDNGTPANPNDDVSFSIGNLALGATANFSSSYFPSSGVLANPGRLEFSDTVRATATPSLGTGPVNGGPITATCLLCPGGSCPLNQTQ